MGRSIVQLQSYCPAIRMYGSRWIWHFILLPDYIIIYPRSAPHVGSMLRYVAHYDDSSRQSNNLAPRLRRCLVNTRYPLMSILLSLTRDGITRGPLTVALTIVFATAYRSYRSKWLLHRPLGIFSRILHQWTANETIRGAKLYFPCDSRNCCYWKWN